MLSAFIDAACREVPDNEGNIMNKLTKGAIAGAAGIALLLGGAGSFALWNANASVTGGAITAGTLTLSPVTSGAGAATWKDLTTGHTGTITPSTFTIVPGDTIQLQQDLTITGSGNDLVAKLTSNAASLTGALAPALGTATVAQTYTATNGTVTGDTVSSSNGTVTVHATITISWPFGTAPSSNTTGDNAYQGQSATLGDVGFTITQLDPSSN
jgi:alternate signal-mediated exported protein, RER_14450 family